MHDTGAVHGEAACNRVRPPCTGPAGACDRHGDLGQLAGTVRVELHMHTNAPRVHVDTGMKQHGLVAIMGAQTHNNTTHKRTRL